MDDHEPLTLQDCLNKPALGRIVVDDEDSLGHAQTPTLTWRPFGKEPPLCRELIQPTGKGWVSES